MSGDRVRRVGVEVVTSSEEKRRGSDDVLNEVSEFAMSVLV